MVITEEDKRRYGDMAERFDVSVGDLVRFYSSENATLGFQWFLQNISELEASASLTSRVDVVAPPGDNDA